MTDDPYDKSIIGNQLEKPQLETQSQPQTQIDYIKILTDAALRHPKEVNHFLDTVIGKPGKSLLISGLKQSNPQYAMIIDRIFPVNGNGNGERPTTRRNNYNNDIDSDSDSDIDYDDSGNPLDDNEHGKDYSIPDTEILDEIRAFACSLHLSGYGWSAISDQIFSKYDIDWNPLKIKDIVLKNLAWNHKSLQPVNHNLSPTPTMPLETSTMLQDAKKGLIRRFLSWLY